MSLDLEQSLEVLAKGSKSFSFAARFLPRSRRLDAARVYAFCRMVDDIADDTPSDERALLELARIESELTRVEEARPEVRQFLDTARRRGVDIAHARELLEGVRSDRRRVRIRDDRDMIRYGYRVAGTVGLLMCPVLGVRNPRAWPFAIDLGVAMQITNICRDVLEDARAGRVYLPEARLAQAGLTAEELLSGTADPERISVVVANVLNVAEAFYRSASNGLAYIPFWPRLAITVASGVYRQIGVRLLRRGANPLVGRTVVPGWEKVWVSTRSMSAFLSPVYWGLIRPKHDGELHDALRGLPGANGPAVLAAKGVAL